MKAEPFTKAANIEHAEELMRLANERFGLEQCLEIALKHIGVHEALLDTMKHLAKARKLHLFAEMLDVHYPKEKS